VASGRGYSEAFCAPPSRVQDSNSDRIGTTREMMLCAGRDMFDFGGKQNDKHVPRLTESPIESSELSLYQLLEAITITQNINNMHLRSAYS